jgi:hypothetical protein
MDRHIDDLLLRIRGLVRVREQLQQAGANAREIERHSAQIGLLQKRLAHRVRSTLRQEGARAG